MSAETDFLAALYAHGALTNLVGESISKNAVPPGAPLPFLVFSTASESFRNLDDTEAAVLYTFTAQAWAKEAPDAAEVADEVASALDAYSATQPNMHATVLNRSSVYDGELDLNAEVLTVEWWSF